METTKNSIQISIVTPVYRAEKILPELISRLNEELIKITREYEIILVDDLSPDNSWTVITKLANTQSNLKAIKLSRNFGQHNAISAGLKYATGEYVVVMDCDLQDNPKYIKDLVEKAKGGFDVTYTVKKKREHGFLKNITASFFHSIFNYLVGSQNVIKTDGNIGAYSLITKKVAAAYNTLNDEYRPYLVMLNVLGFNSSYIVIEHEKRFSGKSSYGIKKLINHALNGIISQTDRLLKLSIYVGLIYMMFSIIYGLNVLYKAIFSQTYPGWSSIVLLITFSTAIVLFFLGIIGLYIGRIFLQVKNRPAFIVDKSINF